MQYWLSLVQIFLHLKKKDFSLTFTIVPYKFFIYTTVSCLLNLTNYKLQKIYFPSKCNIKTLAFTRTHIIFNINFIQYWFSLLIKSMNVYSAHTSELLIGTVIVQWRAHALISKIPSGRIPVPSYQVIRLVHS